MKLALLFGILGVVLAACNSDVGSKKNPTDINESIVHGKQARSSNELTASVVALVAEVAEGQTLCTGSILSDTSILTAAHCVDENPEKMVVIFAPDIHGAKSENIRPATGFVQNPYWRHPNTNKQGDLAIVHFSGGLPPGYTPVRLAKPREALREGEHVYFMGYGVSNGTSQAGSGVLRGTSTQIIGEQSPTETITDGKQTSVCFGDSGGPAFIQVNNEFVQWGIASSVLNQACNEASIHTNVMNYEAWIRSEISN